MKTTPFISIVTVVYNGEKTIRKTMESVLCQTFKDYEYIIVDGLSKDNTVAIAKEYEPKFQGRLRVYSEKDKGIYDAMNKGIKFAKGDYIWLVNADDWMEPNALRLISDFHKSENLSFDKLIQGGINIIDNNSNEVLYSRICSNNKGFIKSSSNLKMGLFHPSVIISKQIYEKVGLYDDNYYISADVDFSIRCYRAGVELAPLQEVLTNMTDGGISNQLTLGKNIHDWNIRFNKFCSNPFKRVYYLAINIIKLLLRKYMPKKIIAKLLNQ